MLLLHQRLHIMLIYLSNNDPFIPFFMGLLIWANILILRELRLLNHGILEVNMHHDLPNNNNLND